MHHDTTQKYSTFTRFLHWTMALLIAVQFATVFAWKMDESLRFLVNVHKACGALFLLLAVVRVVWALKNRANRPHSDKKARLGHLALYVMMFGVPLSGIVFQGKMPHGAGSGMFLMLILGHIGFAIWHQKRGEKLLERMR